MHEFPEDFYGSQLSVCVAGYIREEKKFGSFGKDMSKLRKWL
jgi:FAD synthase